MTSNISVDWASGRRRLMWDYEDQHVEKMFDVAPAIVTAWSDPPSVIVIEPIVDGGRLDNAVVFNPDGSERLRLLPPDVSREPIWQLGFYAVYPSEGVLVVVFSTRNGDYCGKPNLETGELTDVTHWR